MSHNLLYKKGKTSLTSLNKPCRIMLALLREPKADGFETGGRVFSAGLPSMRDPVCLTAELVLLKGCLKGPEPKISEVMFVWPEEEQHSKALLKKKSSTNSQVQQREGDGLVAILSWKHVQGRFVQINKMASIQLQLQPATHVHSTSLAQLHCANT